MLFGSRWWYTASGVLFSHLPMVLSAPGEGWYTFGVEWKLVNTSMVVPVGLTVTASALILPAMVWFPFYLGSFWWKKRAPLGLLKVPWGALGCPLGPDG